MPAIVRCFALMVVSITLVLSHGHAQDRRAAGQPAASPTIAAKRPVFAGACKRCPWGVLAKVTADALKFYGYDTQICWVCATSMGPRQVGDRTKPVWQQPDPERLRDIAWEEDLAPYMEPPPDAVPDFGATSETNLINAWNGTGDYAKDNKQRRNYRVIAILRRATYLMAAASKRSGITNLRQIKDRSQPTWIVGGADNDIVFDYYGINPEDLKAKGGGIVSIVALREKRTSADVYIGSAQMANTPEQGYWNEASQLNDLVFFDFDEPLLAKLAQQPGYERGTVPLALFRGVDRPIPTVIRFNHFIYARDDTPDDFAYAVAKALDEHRPLFQVQLEPWYYDPQMVGVSRVIPMHPGALKYYRERGYVR